MAKIVDYDEVIAEAVSVLGYGEDEEVAKNFARQWAWRALQSLGTTDDTIQVCEITAKNFLLKKPGNLKELVEIALFDSNGCYIPHIFHNGNKRIYPDIDQYYYTVTLSDGTTTTYYFPIDLSENDNSYVIGTNGDMVTTALIRYYPYPLDASGTPTVREDEVEAIIAYVRWRWSMRRNENQSEIQSNKMLWYEQCDKCKAGKKASDFSQEVRKRIGAIMNRQIPNYNRSQF